MYIIAVFKNRTDTFSFYQLLNSYRVNCSIINTPKQVSIACSISVRFDKVFFDEAFNILKRRHFATFVSFYIVEQTKLGVKVKPIVSNFI